METEQTTQTEQGGASQETARAAPAQEAQKKMDAIVSKMAGAAKPEMPGEPPTPPPSQDAKPKEPDAKPKPVSKLLDRVKTSEAALIEERAKYAELKEKYDELAAKAKDGKATDLDEYKMQQIEGQFADKARADREKYFGAAQEELGDRFETFAQNNEYYAPLINAHAKAFGEALARMENKFDLLDQFYNAFNDGTVDFEKFMSLPAPRQVAVLERAAQLMKEPASKTAPARQVQVSPPAVPVPSDVAAPAEPKDKKAKMDSIVGRLAKQL